MPLPLKVEYVVEQIGDWMLPPHEIALGPRLIAGMVALIFVGFVIGLGWNPTKAQNTVHDNTRDIMSLQFETKAMAAAQATTNLTMSQQIQRLADAEDARKKEVEDLRKQMDHLVWGGGGFGCCISFLLMFPYLRATIFKREGKLIG